MKKFYFIITESKARKYGGLNQKAQIYTIKKGALKYCCAADWCTAAYRGAIHEVFQSLMANGFISKKYEKSSACAWRGGGYFEGEVRNKYSIEEMPQY